MAKDEVAIIGKPVRDMYGTDMGKILGTFTNIDGSIQTVGVDCGSEGLKQIPFVQLVLQGEVVIYIPNWRLEAQKILREKGLTLRRLKALMTIVSENDEMKSDAELIHETYKSKLMNLDDAEAKIKTQLLTRLDELDNQAKTVKIILFDARVQFKSEEISELTFESIQKHCNNLLERLSHERVEINNVQRRIEEMSLESMELIQPKEERVQELAILLNNEVINIANSLGQIGDIKLMVLAAITILDKNQDVIEDAIKIIDNSTKKLEKIYNKIEKKT